MNGTKINEARKDILKCSSNLERKNSLNLTSESLINGIILSEILGEPKGKKGLMSYNVYKSTNSR